MIRFRRATPSDAADLAAMHVAAWRETYDGLVPERMLASLSVAGRTTMWARVLRDGPDVELAVQDTDIAGFVAIANQRSEELAIRGFDGEITALYVLRTVQGAGLGRELMRRAARHLRHRDRSAAALWVLRSNRAACGFYEHLGGRLVAEREDHRPDGTLDEIAYGFTDLAALEGN